MTDSPEIPPLPPSEPDLPEQRPLPPASSLEPTPGSEPNQSPEPSVEPTVDPGNAEAQEAPPSPLKTYMGRIAVRAMWHVGKRVAKRMLDRSAPDHDQQKAKAGDESTTKLGRFKPAVAKGTARVKKEVGESVSGYAKAARDGKKVARKGWEKSKPHIEAGAERVKKEVGEAIGGYALMGADVKRVAKKKAKEVGVWKDKKVAAHEVNKKKRADAREVKKERREDIREARKESNRQAKEEAKARKADAKQASTLKKEGKRAKAASRHLHDEGVYKQAGRTNLNRFSINRLEELGVSESEQEAIGLDMDRTPNYKASSDAAWRKKHRTARKGFGFTTDKVPHWPDPHTKKDKRGFTVDRLRARNFRQVLAEMRENMRASGISTRLARSERFKELYPEADLHDKWATRRYSRSRPRTLGERWSIGQAGRHVRRKDRSAKRMTSRLVRSAGGQDIAGQWARTKVRRDSEKPTIHS